MNVEQVYTLVNQATLEAVGDTAVLNRDLTNVVDIGTAIFNANAVDAYVKALVNHIGRVIFVNRPYRGSVPSVLMDGWEYGSVAEKIRAELPDAQINSTWDLTSNVSYDPNVFIAPTVAAKFFNNKVTFELQLSLAERQVKQSFSNATQLSAFVAMLYNEVDKKMTIATDQLIMSTIDLGIGATMAAESAGIGTTGTKAVNLLYEYNQQFGTSLAATDALTTAEFLKFAAYRIGLYADRLAKPSELFNVEGNVRFTPDDVRHTVFLSDFAKAIGPYSLSPAYNEEYLKLPDAETVPYWQGSGTGYGLSDVSAIDITHDGNNYQFDGILGIMFDRDALAVCNTDKRVTTNYNAKGEFFNNFYKFDCSYFVDLGENFVVFYIA